MPPSGPTPKAVFADASQSLPSSFWILRNLRPALMPMGFPHRGQYLPTPIHCRPFEFGVISSPIPLPNIWMAMPPAWRRHCRQRQFRLTAHADKFPGLTQPDESYHGVTYTETFGKAAYITKGHRPAHAGSGLHSSPQNCFLLNLGLETLFLRVERHCENALAVAKYLEKHDKIEWINYPGLESSPLSCAGPEIYAGRHLRRHRLWHQGRPEAAKSSWTASSWQPSSPCGRCAHPACCIPPVSRTASLHRCAAEAMRA